MLKVDFLQISFSSMATLALTLPMMKAIGHELGFDRAAFGNRGITAKYHFVKSSA